MDTDTVTQTRSPDERMAGLVEEAVLHGIFDGDARSRREFREGMSAKRYAFR